MSAQTRPRGALRIDARLLVGLRGPDLVATTARLALVDKMGFGDRLAGLQRYDFFHFVLEGDGPAEAQVDGLTRVLARQSTFYNRNKHMYSLECGWDGASRHDGPTRDDLGRRFGELLGTQWERSRSGSHGTGTDFDGKGGSKADIVNTYPVFRVEVAVQDDDSASRDGIAAKLTRELSGSGSGTSRVQCPGRATVWWLGIAARDEAAAMETARRIAVTKRRDAGLLMNPNYQRADFVSAGRVDRVRS